ncbi:MAG: Ig-like domain-containing protein [Eubacteriaceae bacterium]|nr:Ig-like domain-containing protein [Eubacteriaceae bacterium]
MATVDQNGKVKAVAAGTATITAQAYGSDVKAECVVNVIAVHADAIDIVLYNNDGTTTEPENGKIRIRLGDSFRLKAVTDPEEITDDVIWETSDESIVKINSYINRVPCANPSFFVAQAPGTAKIRVTSSYDDGINAGSVSKTVEVEVYEIPAETVTLDTTEATLLYGETLKLTATVNPTNHTDGRVQWFSSDENVVTVNNGNIAVVGAGEATVTAKIKDIEATCKITVPEFYMQTEELPTFTLSTVGWPGQVDKLAISGREVVKVEWDKDESGKLLPSATVILKEGTEDGTKLIGVMDYSLPSYSFSGSSTKTVTVEGGKAEMDLQYGYYSGLFGGNVKLTFMDESLLPVYGFEVVLDKDEYKENEDAVAKVYLKNYRNKDLDANVLGYALSFNEDAFVVKNTQAGENLVDELSTKEDGLIVRKLRLEADVEDFAIAQEGILIDTITFKAVGDGMINAELTAVENDVDLNDESTFVTVFIEETAQAENVLTDGIVTYTRIVSEDKAKAAVVDEIIAKIGEIVEFSDFEIMHQAREAYENLEDEVKQYVEKLNVLEETEKCHAFWKNGDVNVDGVINGQDLSIILGTYGEEVTELNAHCDINVDEMSEGLINGGDLSVVLGSYATIIE